VNRTVRKDLLPGTYVNAFIETGTETVTALPNEAIFKTGETENICKHSVWYSIGRITAGLYFAPKANSPWTSTSYVTQSWPG